MNHIVAPPEDESRHPRPDAHACAVLALSILNHREHTAANLELAVMALRGATFPDLIAADRQMAGATDGN